MDTFGMPSVEEMRKDFIISLRTVGNDLKETKVVIPMEAFASFKLSTETIGYILEAIGVDRIAKAATVYKEGVMVILTKKYGSKLISAANNEALFEELTEKGELDFDEQMGVYTIQEALRTIKKLEGFSGYMLAFRGGAMGALGFYKLFCSNKENIDQFSTFCANKFGRILNEMANFLERAEVKETSPDDLVAEISALMDQAEKTTPDLNIVKEDGGNDAKH